MSEPNIFALSTPLTNLAKAGQQCKHRRGECRESARQYSARLFPYEVRLKIAVTFFQALFFCGLEQSVKFGRCERPLGSAFCCSCENLHKFGLGISLWKARLCVKTCRNFSNEVVFHSNFVLKTLALSISMSVLDVGCPSCCPQPRVPIQIPLLAAGALLSSH